MYELTANDDYTIEKFKDIEDARAYGRTLIAHRWFLYCRIYHNGDWVEDVK